MSAAPVYAAARLVASAFLVATLSVGCAAPTASPSPTNASPIPAHSATPGPTGSPAELLIEVTSQGGFINPTASIAALPVVDVDSDGHIYTPGQPADANAPLVAPVDMRDVGPDGASMILAAIRYAGLDHEVDGGGVAADTGVAIFTVVVDGEQIVNRFANAGPGGGPGGQGSAGDVRSAAFDLLNRLTDPDETWGAGAAAVLTYTPTAYRLFFAPSDQAASARQDWPLAIPLAELGAPAAVDFGIEGLRTAIISGVDAGAFGGAVANTQSDTSFLSGGQAYAVWVRALLPDELN